MNSQLPRDTSMRPSEPFRAWFNGSGALSQGMGLCYDWDYGTATDRSEQRMSHVELPTNANNNAFAGVVRRAYSAKTGGQVVELDPPGAITDLAITAAVTLGQRVTCIAGGTNAGKWMTGGFAGRGSAKVRQTQTDTSLCAMAELEDGPESGMIEVIPTATLTAGGAITCMVGGVTVFDGPATPLSDCTFTVADGQYAGQRKGFYQDGDLTTKDVILTTTHAVQLNGTTALATMTLDGDTDYSVLEYSGRAAPGWKLIHNVGTVLA